MWHKISAGRKGTKLMKIRRLIAYKKEQKQPKNKLISSRLTYFVIISHSQRCCLFSKKIFSI